MDLYDKLIVTARFERYANHDNWLCAQYQVAVSNPDNGRSYSTEFRVGLRDEIVKEAGKYLHESDKGKFLRRTVERLIKEEKAGNLRNTTYKPSKQDVLYAICSDAENTDQPFEDWASDLGYDTDSRKAENIYNQCVRTRHALVKLCGSAEALEQLTQRTRDIDNSDEVGRDNENTSV